MHLSIGQLAKAVGVGVETVRFYEREGLIPRPARRPSGYRQFTPDTVDRIRFIRRARELGFSLSEVGELLALESADEACAGVLQRAQEKLADVRDRIRDLQRIEITLTQLTEACPGEGPADACPILAVLHENQGI